LPEALSITGTVTPKKLKRGIFDVVVYQSDLGVSGNFSLKDKIDTTNLVQINYHQATLTIGISDLRGIKDEIIVDWNGEKLPVKPGSKVPDMIYSGVSADLPSLETLELNTIPFQFALNLQGSQNLAFTPIGNVTTVELRSDWSSPSFNGNFLPNKRDVSAEGFSAQWKVLQLNRNFPQYWTGDQYANKVDDASFGVDLILPLDDYQKSTRSTKYSIMTIGLTFLVFFLVEVLNKRKIHPLQYALVGLSLCAFYILLVSISEHTNFNVAYCISSVGIILMITLYSISVFQVGKLSALLAGIMAGIYGFLFVTLQLADYALLMGSVGITIILALTMYFTRNINWYKINMEE
jgi:inner membrane protein